MAGEWWSGTVGELLDRDGGSVKTGPFGTVLKADEYSLTGVPLISVGEIGYGTFKVSRKTPRVSPTVTERLPEYLLRDGDIVFGRKGAVDRSVIVRKDQEGWFLGSDGIRLRLPGTCDPLFCAYQLQSSSNRSWLLQHATGTTMASLNQATVGRMPLTLPPIAEQRRIAGILGSFDDKIELNRRMSETLEAMARALFKSWFVDFELVRAKAERRDTGLPKEIVDLFPDSFDDSELGEIPNGWSVKRVEEVARKVGMGPFGSSIRVDTFVADGVPVISGQHLWGISLEDTTFNFLSPEHADRLKSANVGPGDVVFTHAGSIGQVAYIPDGARYKRYVISQRQFFLRCDPDVVTPTFLVLYFKSPRGQHQLLANTSSSGVPSIARPVSYLRTIQIIVPPSSVIAHFERSVEPLLKRSRGLRDESLDLAALRDRLLPKLVSGALSIPDSKGIVEARA